MSSDRTPRRRGMRTLKQELPYPHTRICPRSSGVREEEVADAISQIVSGQDAVRSIHRLNSLMLTRLLTSPMFRLGLIAAAEAEGDPVIREAISERHREATPLWRKACEDFLGSRDLRIRPGITIDDCIALLSALADGLAMRALADPSAAALDHDDQRSLLGMGALALIAGCLQRTGDESQSLEQVVSDLLGSSPAAAERRMA
jgi:hypothetical protein